QRDLAAFLAIALRLSGVSFFARAFPPFKPPFRRPGLGWISLSFSTCPVAISPISLASCIGSRGRLGRFAMPGVCHSAATDLHHANPQTETLPRRPLR